MKLYGRVCIRIREHDDGGETAVIVCDYCREPLGGKPQLVLQRVKILNMKAEMKLPEELRSVMGPLIDLSGPERQQQEVLGVFDKTACLAKWAEEHKEES